MTLNLNTLNTGVPSSLDERQDATYRRETGSYSESRTELGGGSTTEVLELPGSIAAVSNYCNLQTDNSGDRLLSSSQLDREVVCNGKNVKNYVRKFGIKLASLNMQGRNDSLRKSKYKTVSTLVRRNKIAVIATQETRLKAEEELDLMLANPKIIVISNPLPITDSRSRSAGVGFVLQKDLFQNKTWQHTVLIPGRMSRLQVDWTNDQGMDIINLYPPNDLGLKIAFLREAETILSELSDLKDPILTADWNFTENAIDRSPEHKDDNVLLGIWNSIKTKLNLVDGWRTLNPEDHTFTFSQESGKRMSRIDRIYVPKSLFRHTMDWDVTSAANLSDHQLVSMAIMKANLPVIGKGIFRLRAEDLNALPCKEKMSAVLLKCSSALNRYTKDEGKVATNIKKLRQLRKANNPQKIWKDTKAELEKVAAAFNKERVAILTKERNTLFQKKNSIERKIRLTNDQALKDLELAKLHKIQLQMGNREKVDIEAAQQSAKAHYKKDGAKMTKYYFNLYKPAKDDATIYALRNADNRVVNDTDRMIDIANKHHSGLLQEPSRTDETHQAVNDLLDSIDTSLSEEQKEMFKMGTTPDQVWEALKATKNGKAPGMDGITYEFYKHWERPDSNETSENEVDIGWILAQVFIDIEKHGLSNTKFVDGVMYLLFKKKDRTQVANYRPLTLLNTDYKLFTKTIATKLGEVAPSVIHENQAGFVPGRSLYNHVRLSSAMIDYCEAEEIDGCIVSLDQEKAYDKIAHDYLWKVLERFGFPKRFIKTVKSLYKNATTYVMVNKVLSKDGLQVKRGVRQGDPMSCLLYALAIEPLGNLLRKSELKGIQVSGLRERVLVTLFADDTLVYMNKEDDLKTLTSILDKFCIGSTAKFNLEKTEYLPIGSKAHREKIATSRTLNELPSNTCVDGTRIVKDGESMRTLGAFVGNGITQYPKWNIILEKQKAVLEMWEKHRPTLFERIMILKALAQSRALFLAMVSGMPMDIADQMASLFHGFLWEHKRNGLIPWNQAIAPVEEGGLNAPDIHARLEAIQIMELKDLLAPIHLRPDYAGVREALVFLNVYKERYIDPKSILSWISQSWHESEAKWNTIPKQVHAILKVGRKYNVALDALKFSTEVKETLPFWHNMGVSNNHLWNKKAGKCLLNTHNVRTMEDAITFMRSNRSECDTDENCKTLCGKILALIPTKFRADVNTPHRDGLDHTIRRLESKKTRSLKKTGQLYNPDVTERTDANASVRIFGTETRYKTRKYNDNIVTLGPACRDQASTVNLDFISLTTVYIDGSSTKNGDNKAIGGAGIYYGVNDHRNKALRIKGKGITSALAELYALIWVLLTNVRDNLTIVSDSETTINGVLNHSKCWEDVNWIGTENVKEWKAILYLLRRRTAPTTFKWIASHQSTTGENDEEDFAIESNNAADLLAKEGTRLPEEEEVSLEVPPEWDVRGARLSSLTQKTAYKNIIELKKVQIGATSNGTVNRNLQMAQSSLRLANKTSPRHKTLWKGMKDEAFSPQFRAFLWKAINGKIKVGKFFRFIPGWSEKEFCTCGATESLEHIFLNCQDNGCRQLWNHVKLVWEQSCTSNQQWIEPDMGLIYGLGSFKFVEELEAEDEDEEVIKGHLSYKYKSFIADAVWTLWKARNARVFNHPNINTTKEELIEKWDDAIGQRILTEWMEMRWHPFSKREELEYQVRDRWCYWGVLAKYYENTHSLDIVIGSIGKSSAQYTDAGMVAH